MNKNVNIFSKKKKNIKTKYYRNEIINLNTPNREIFLRNGCPSKANPKFVIGRGSFGTVFRAQYQGEDVAVKIVRNHKDSEVNSVDNEARILDWKHKNIIRILKIETAFYTNYSLIIMEHLNAHNLFFIIEKISLPLIHRIQISKDVSNGLYYCHSKGLIHGDIKPQNILLSFHKSSYVCKICDFGSSSAINEPKVSNLGTMRYLSPEVLRNEAMSPSSDMFALGVTMWQMKSAESPYNWIDCNHSVAYKVVKYDIRPDSGPELVYFDQFLSVPRIQVAKQNSPFKRRNVTSGKPETPSTPLKAKPLSGDSIDFQRIFADFSKPSQNLEQSYEKLYKNCWKAVPKERLTAEKLLVQLNLLIKKLC
ncbi:Mos family protein [Megaselia abdita]